MACEHGGGAGRVPLRRLGNRSGPTLVHRLDEQGVPAVEELDPERLDVVHVLMRVEDEAAVARFSQKDPTPVIDELRDVDGPVHLGDLTEYGREEVVEDDLPIEADDQIMDVHSFETGSRVPFRVIPRGRISGKVKGPAIVTEETTTTYVDVEWTVSNGTLGDLILERTV